MPSDYSTFIFKKKIKKNGKNYNRVTLKTRLFRKHKNVYERLLQLCTVASVVFVVAPKHS